VPLGGVVLAGAVGRIVESNAEGWAVGQAVRGHLGAQTIATLKPDLLEKVDGDVGPLSLHLGLLGGSTGVTAWIGMTHVAKVQPGDVFVVSAACRGRGLRCGTNCKEGRG
jgi:NADPH-dependent curcumin reductase CurA